jgi:hypothetical protein
MGMNYLKTVILAVALSVLLIFCNLTNYVQDQWMISVQSILTSFYISFLLPWRRFLFSSRVTLVKSTDFSKPNSFSVIKVLAWIVRATKHRAGPFSVLKASLGLCYGNLLTVTGNFACAEHFALLAEGLHVMTLRTCRLLKMETCPSGGGDVEMGEFDGMASWDLNQEWLICIPWKILRRGMTAISAS